MATLFVLSWIHKGQITVNKDGRDSWVMIHEHDRQSHGGKHSFQAIWNPPNHIKSYSQDKKIHKKIKGK